MPLLESGQPVVPLAPAAQAPRQSAAPLPEEPRQRLDTQLTVALAAPQQIAPQSRRLPTGKTRTQGQIVKAYDPTIAPIGKGKRNCPTPFGRKPGSIAELASGFSCAFQLPVGKPADPSSVVPVVDKGQRALEQTSTHPPPPSTRWLGLWP
jgi:hypothetical protein